MVRYSSFVTPDQRMRRIENQTQREFQRKLRLDAIEKERSDDIQAQMQQEQQRGAELDLGQEMQFETERARGLELDRQSSSIIRDFQPSPSPSGRFVDRIAEQPESARQFQAQFPGEDVPGTVPQPAVGVGVAVGSPNLSSSSRPRARSVSISTLRDCAWSSSAPLCCSCSIWDCISWVRRCSNNANSCWRSTSR